MHRFHIGKKFLWWVMNRLGKKKTKKKGWGIMNTWSCDSYWTLDWQQTVRTLYGEGQSKPAREKVQIFPLIHIYMSTRSQTQQTQKGHLLTLAGIRAASTVKQLTQEAITSTGGEITVVSLGKRNIMHKKDCHLWSSLYTVVWIKKASLSPKYTSIKPN